MSALGIDGQGACSRGQLLQAGDGAGDSEEAAAGPQAGREVLWGSLSPRAAWALLPLLEGKPFRQVTDRCICFLPRSSVFLQPAAPGPGCGIGAAGDTAVRHP